eukprot:TRINITY_DN22450_c0_g1_i2.p1 TRINITY_DN22450_c0_g1~~TRINITY_DN22450_c0_g1_i2.p1  ORF type:complete len:938 (+),score=323.95 TRINITY_DN22450_c0_g1_i2:103-2916(+)
MATRAPVGEAATTWSAALDLFASNKFDEARKLGQDTLARGQQYGLKTVEAAGALVVALSYLGKVPTSKEFIELLLSLKATWSEAAVLLSAGGSGGVTGPWGKAGDAGKSVAAGLQKAGSDAAAAFNAATNLAQQVGALWTEKLTTISVKDLSSSTGDDESTLKQAIDVPASVKDPKQRAAALIRAALAQLKLEMPQAEEALRNAKEALATYRELNLPESEGAALRVISMASLGQNAFESLQAASQSLKVFKDAEHAKGQAAAIHCIAQAHLGRQSGDDCLFKAGEALKLSRQIGDRMREAAVLQTMIEANLIRQDGRQASTAAVDAVAVARSLGDRLLEAKMLCFLAKAKGASGEAGADEGVQASKDAMAIYQELGLKSMEGEALEAMGSACKGRKDPQEALSCGQRMADKYRQQGDKKEEAATMYRIACIHQDNQELDQALRAAQDALGSFKEVNDRRGEAETLKLLAKIRLEKEEPGEAAKAAEQACAMYRNQAFATRESRDSEIECIKAMVDANAMMGSVDEGQRIAGEAQRRFHSLKEKRGEGMALLSIAKLHQQRGETEDAMNALVQAPPLFLAVGDKLGEGQAWENIGRIHLNNGQAGNAQRAAEEAALAFRKHGDKKSRAGVAQLVANVHFALATVGAANAQNALSAAQEGASLYKDLGEKRSGNLSLQVLANAQLLSQNWEDALKTAQDAEVAFKAARELAGEAAAMLLQAGAYLGSGQFEECKRVAKEASDCFRAAGDGNGEDSVEEFLDQVTGYEKGQKSLEDFHGFVMRQATATKAGSGPAKRDRTNRRPPKISNISDIELIKADSSKDSKVTLAFFDGFESRSAGGPKPAPAAAGGGTAGPGFSKGLEDFKPEKEQVLYSVRWVQASAGKAGANAGQKVGKREFTKEEDKRQMLSMQLGAPKENWGSRYGKTNRLFEAAAPQRGV